MNPDDNVAPPEPNKPFGPAADAGQPKPVATPENPVGGATPPPAGTPPTPDLGQPSATPAPNVGTPSVPQDNSPLPAGVDNSPLPGQQAQQTPPAMQPVGESGNPMPAMPTAPTGPKPPHSSSLPAMLLAGVVIIFLVVLAIYAFTKI